LGRQGQCRAGGRCEFFEGLVGNLLAFANHQFERLSKAGDGNAVGEHIDAAKRHPLYKADEADEAPDVPYELEYIWNWFLKLSRKRQSGFGPGPITSEEIVYWCVRQGVTFTPFEHTVIDQLDDLYLSHQYKKDK
jgi:hypothetical protein